MASEDVIELGSSEDEAEPAPKKRKPMPNAMVHIPANIPGLIIKPTKPVNNSGNKGVLSKPIVIMPSKPIISNITRLKGNVISGIPQSDTNITRSKTNSVLGLSQADTKITQLKTNVISGLSKSHTNIVKLQTGMISSIPIVSKMKPTRDYLINPISIKNMKQSLTVKKASGNTLRNPFHTPGSKILNNLPPSITIKKTQLKKPMQIAGISGLRCKKPNVVIKKRVGEVPTVDLDEEDINDSSTPSPQWYMRPEESIAKNEVKNDSIKESQASMEEQNNKEPEVTKYVEITIEDSPIKIVSNKHTGEIGRELPITIEDSPIKPKTKDLEDEVKGNERNCKNIPQSKKKLDYPNNVQSDEQVFEIEIDSVETCAMPNNDVKENDVSISIESNAVSEVSSTKDKEVEEGTLSTDKSPDKDTLQVQGDSEFHPIYQAFIDTCFKLENSEDMKIIVEKKIKTYYKQCPKEYVESEEFTDMVSSKITSMKAGPEKMYLYIKDIVDELNLQRKMAKSEILNKEIITTETNEKFSGGEYSDYDSKKQRQVRKLEKTIKKLHRAIQKLEEQEVDFEDEDDSVYLLTERYKERMVRVHAKFCQLTNTKMPSEPRILIEARIGRPNGPAKKLEKWINKKVPIGTPLPFPDFHDVLRCVRDANDEDKLGWNEVDIMEEARDLFARCGKKLQRRRQENEWRVAASRISNEVDPAENSDELKSKLNENKLVAAKKESEVLNSFVDRQHQLKLEAEEIGDKEAEESPIESEDEEPNDNSSLGDKHKRKERLKRLLIEKNKKAAQSPIKPSEETAPQTEVSIDNEEESKINNSTHNEENKSTNNEANVENDDSQTSNAYSATGTMDIDELNNNEDKVETVSDSSIESDIDELHLLQKLHSENEANSSISESSDSDTPIAISDTLDSDSEVENVKEPFDVISIENSSYSESETNVEADVEENNIKEIDQNIESLVNANLEIEFSMNKKVSKITPTSSKEDDTENILLASSDEDGNVDKDCIAEDDETCINLKDDTISISETVIGVGLNEVKQKETSTDDEASITDEVEGPPKELITVPDNSMDVSDNGNEKHVIDSCESLNENKSDNDEQIERMDCSETSSNHLEQGEIDKDK